MFGGLTRFFGATTNGGTGGGAVVDIAMTGEGCQSITDLGWKKWENKYMGVNSLAERELKD